jgi:hypothetical protein
LLAIRETEVVLRLADGNRETLKMFPDIELSRKMGQASPPKAARK